MKKDLILLTVSNLGDALPKQKKQAQCHCLTVECLIRFYQLSWCLCHKRTHFNFQINSAPLRISWNFFRFVSESFSKVACTAFRVIYCMKIQRCRRYRPTLYTELASYINWVISIYLWGKKTYFLFFDLLCLFLSWQREYQNLNPIKISENSIFLCVQYKIMSSKWMRPIQVWKELHFFKY